MNQISNVLEFNMLQNRNMKVAGQTLPVEILLSEERFYNDAAELLNKKFRDYEKKYSKTPPSKVLAMAAYDVIVCLMRYCDPLATDLPQDFSSFNEQIEKDL